MTIEVWTYATVMTVANVVLLVRVVQCVRAYRAFRQTPAQANGQTGLASGRVLTLVLFLEVFILYATVILYLTLSAFHSGACGLMNDERPPSPAIL